MGRKLRQTVTALATTALAAGAIVAVFYALPDGSDTVSPSNAAASVTTTAPSGTTTNSAASTIAVPALVNTGSTVIESSTEATSEQPTTSSSDIPTTTTAVEQVSETMTTAEAVVATTSQAPVGTTGPAAPQTTAAKTTAPPTTAPRTTAPKTTPVTTKSSTTAPKTTAPKTTAPPTTAPKTTSPKATAPDFGIPVSTGSAQQVITVAVTSKAATSGTLRAWQQQADGSWTVVFGPVKAWLGKQGIGTPSESASRTPQGTYTLTQAFGALANPGTGLPYRVTAANDWWVSDVRSPEYNTWQTCAAAACPFNTKAAEHLKYITPYYDYAVVMDVNRSPVVAGGGSAFFLHVSVGAPTEGCVAIDKATLVSILRWLDPAQHPRIAVGIG